MSEENIDKEIYDAEMAAEAKIAKLESGLKRLSAALATKEKELGEAKERIKTTAKNGIACVIASEDKLAAQSALISRMREVLEEAKGCLATLLWDAMKHDAVSKSLEKYEGIGKRITDVLARCETEVPSSNG